MDQLREAATSSRVVPAEIEKNEEDLVSAVFTARKEFSHLSTKKGHPQ